MWTDVWLGTREARVREDKERIEPPEFPFLSLSVMDKELQTTG